MADNTNITPGTGEIISTDDLGGGVKVQRVKAQFGVDGSATDVSSVAPLPASPVLYNGTIYEAQRNNVEGTLLASAARTANAQSANQTNYNARGVMIWLNVSAKAATTTLGLSLIGVSPDAPGNFQEYARITAWAAPINTSAMLIVYPGATTAPDTASAINVASARSLPLPRTWFITTTHGDASSITYSVGYSLVV